MPKPTKAYLENEYGVPVYVGWHLVPLLFAHHTICCLALLYSVT